MKRFLAGILTFAMAASMMTATAFAEPDVQASNNETADENENKVSSPGINTDWNGSLTIHKYIYDVEVEGWPEKSTGEELTVPEDAKPLKGVQFSVYQIAGKEDMLKYYSGDEELAKDVKVPTQEELYMPHSHPSFGNPYFGDDYVCIKDYTTGKWVLNPFNNKYNIDIKRIGTTDENGLIKFDLELGIYLVIETDSPDAVAEPADPFLVSIPTTVDIKGTDGKVTGSEWIYDVHVYPKNTIVVSGEVQMVKVGNSTDNTLPGVKFKLEKYEAVTEEWGTRYEWKQVTSTIGANGEEIPLPNEGILTSSDTGVVSVSNLAPGTYRFVEISTVDGYILPDNGAWYFDINSNGNTVWQPVTPSGYDYTDKSFIPNYRSEDKADADAKFKVPGEPDFQHPSYTACPIIGGIPYAINVRPDIEKGVVPKGTPKEENGYADNAYKKEADYSIGDKIPHKLTIKVPKDAVNMKTLNIFDDPINMEDDLGSIKMQINGSDITEELAKYGELTPYNEKGFKFSFSGGGMALEPWADSSEITITIEYTATLLDSSVTAIGGNPNMATLEYSNSYRGNGTNKITDRTVVYSGEIDVHKTDGTKTEKLSGVEFELYEQQEVGVKPGDMVGTKQTLTQAEAKAKGFSDYKATAYIKIGDTYTTNSDGNVSMKGLSDGKYWLVETKTAADYNLLREPVPVQLALGYKTEMENSTWQSESKSITGSSYNSNTHQWEVVTKTEVVFTLEKNVIDSSASTYEQIVEGTDNLGKSITVINRKGFDLPATGGMGTFIFTFVGIAMMAAAVILLVTSKKKEAR